MKMFIFSYDILYDSVFGIGDIILWDQSVFFPFFLEIFMG